MKSVFAAATLAALTFGSLMAQTVKADARTVTLSGHVNARALAGTDNGRAQGTFPLNDLVLTLRPNAAQQAALDAFLAAQQDPAAPDYHNWLTPAQFADRFGPSPADLASITDWLTSAGFTLRDVAPSRNSISFSGTAALARTALSVDIHRYTVAGEAHFATATNPQVPAGIADIVAGFRGFDDFLPQRPVGQAKPAYTAGSGNHYVTPDDVATIYNVAPLYAKGFDGTGQTVAIVGQSAINISDVQTFRTLFNLPKNDPTLVSVPGLTVPAVVSGDVMEADLDVEWAGAVAKNAGVVYVYSTNVFNALQYAVTQNLASVVSISYGTCETGATGEGLALRAIAQQANAQGMTLISASGDSGAFACENGTATVASHGVSVTLPASVPEVTGVGGTMFVEGTGSFWNATNNANNGSAISYIPEAVWNESANGGPLGASGGGVSAQFGKPIWQAGNGVPNDGARDVPDIAMAAAADHDGTIICTNGGCAKGIAGASVVGGTSVAAPLFAGITALLNQYQLKSGTIAKAGLGNLNPTLYALALKYADAFHDITSGNNVSPCRTGSGGCTTGSFGYSAGTGYDLATGLGSVNAFALATDWSLIKSAPAALLSVQVSPGSVAGGGTAGVSVLLTAPAPTGGATVALSGGSTAFPVPASIVVPAGQLSASVNVVATAVTASTPLTLTASYNGTSKTANVTVVTVVLPNLTSVSVLPATVAGGASAVVSVVLSAAAPAGGATVALSSSSAAFPVPATLVVAAGVKTASITVQTTTVTASTPVTITAKYNGGTQTASATVAPVVLPSLTSVSVPQASVTGGAASLVTVTLSAAAPVGGVSVSLTSNSAAFPVPSTLVVPAGQKTASASVQTVAVTASTPVTITAKYNGATQTATVTVAPVVLPTLSSVSVSQASVAGGANAYVTVTLSAAAPPAGATVTLSSNSSAFPVPASIVVPVGQRTASVNVQTAAVTASTVVTITAKYNGGTQTANVTITPVVLPALSAVTITQGNSIASLAGPFGVAVPVVTVTLAAAAPPGGASVALSSSSAAFPVPATLTVPAGQKSASVVVQPGAVTATTVVTVTAKYNGGTQTATITLSPLTLSSVTITPPSPGGGTLAFVSVHLSGAAPAGGISVALSSNSSAFPVPATLTVPAGAADASTQVQTLAVKASTPVTVTATYGGVSKAASLTLTPVVIPTLASVSVSAATVKGGSNVTLTITLSGPAPSSGATITLASNNAAVPLPAAVTMFPGATSGTLRVQTKAVTASTPVTITASSGGTTQTATVTVTP